MKKSIPHIPETDDNVKENQKTAIREPEPRVLGDENAIRFAAVDAHDSFSTKASAENEERDEPLVSGIPAASGGGDGGETPANPKPGSENSAREDPNAADCGRAVRADENFTQPFKTERRIANGEERSDRPNVGGNAERFKNGTPVGADATPAKTPAAENALAPDGIDAENSDLTVGEATAGRSDNGFETNEQSTEVPEAETGPADGGGADRSEPTDGPNDGGVRLPPPPKPESNKKKWAKRILLLFVFAFTFYAMYLITSALGGGDVASLPAIMEATDMRFFVSAVLLACFLFFTEAFKFSILSRMTVKKFHYGTCFTTGVVGKFYDNITPFATGGQPFQMVHLAKKGYPTGVATAIPTLKYIIQLYVFILVSIVLYIINPGALDYLDPTSRGVIQTACYVGLVFAVSAPSLFVFFSFAPKTADKIVSFFIRLLAKIKIVKDFDRTHGKVLDFVKSYQFAFKQLFGKGWGILFLVVVCIADCLLYFAFPYFLLVGMGGTRPSWKLMLDVATLNSYSFFAASLIPTPGNSGAIEASYSMVFAPVAVNEGTLFWIVFLWRFLTYYLYIFVGIFFNLGRWIQKKVRARREKIG